MRISTRIISGAMLVVAAVNIVYAVYFVGTERKSALDQLQTTMTENDKLLKVVIAGPLYDGNIEQLDATLDSFFSNPDIVGIELREYNGNIRLTRQRTPGAMGAVSTSRAVITRKLDDLGEIVTTYSTARVEQRLRTSRNEILGFSTVLVLGLAVVIYLVARGFTRPLERLTEAARDMTNGNLDRDIESSGGQEMESLAGSFLTMRDAIREKMADLAAQNEVMRLRDRAIESSVNAIAIADAAGMLSYVNPSFLRLWGYDDASQVQGRSALEFWQDPERAARTIQALYAHGMVTGELIARKKDGTFFPVELSANLMTDEAGKPSYLLGFFIDLTERKHAEEEKKKLEAQLVQAQKMESIGTLAGGIAHDFNNILAAIVGYGNVLQMKMRNDDPLGEYVNQILTSAERAARLTQSLLAFSRKQVISPQYLDLNESMRKVEKFLTRIIGEDIILTTTLSTEKLIIYADVTQIEQVLMNLATNARDAMPKGGRLMIETGRVMLDEEYVRSKGYGTPGPYVQLNVSDTGEGMDEQTQRKIFEPFFTTKELGRGTGLGLAIVYGVVKQNNGYINVYSEPGRGTTFKIYLPLVSSLAGEDRPPKVQQPLQGGTETILLAEDDETVRMLNREVLQEFGYAVIEAADGEDALQKFREHRDRISLFILDVIMPKKSGREVFEEARKTSPNLKAIFTSGYPADLIQKEGVLERGLHFLSKPSSPDVLLRKVREVLDHEPFAPESFTGA